jgi:hypothetical protein
MKKNVPDGESASALIDKRIKELGDWRGKTLAKVRQLIKEADPEIVEEWKWMGIPTWSHNGLVCTGEIYKSVVKMTFAKGASQELRHLLLVVEVGKHLGFSMTKKLAIRGWRTSSSRPKIGLTVLPASDPSSSPNIQSRKKGSARP